MIEFNEEEREASDALLNCMQIINRRWELQHNKEELAAAVHVIQGFIVQHMLNRLEPENWGSWYRA